MGRDQRRWLVQRDDGHPAGLSTDRARATAGTDAHSFDRPARRRKPGRSTLHDRRDRRDGKPIATRVGTPDFAYLADFAWAADGRTHGCSSKTARTGEAARRRRGIALAVRSDGSRREYPGSGSGRELRHPRCRDRRRTVAGHHRHRFAEQLARAFVAEYGAGRRASGIWPRQAGSPGWAGPQLDYDPD